MPDLIPKEQLQPAPVAEAGTEADGFRTFVAVCTACHQATVQQPDGTIEKWMIEGGTPNTLFRRGFTKKSLLPGTKIVVDGYQAKDGSLKGNGRDLTFPDGRKLFMGSSGTGAPRDGSDPTERKKKPKN